MTDRAVSDFRETVQADFLHWVAVARDIVTDHFPSERTEPHNQMVIDTVRSLMIAERLGTIETTLEGLRQVLAHSKES
ncbi:MAG: hypothetical protein H6897_04170 [Rhodobacteraceae bacterium]|jgi:hypothetical protein|uniref:hypothetical protein n=1 Tax=Albidovulum sp. TaxID=1872424 RepID=UPI001DE8F248|nr:hypothetical protein [uncultured Defluviimonas sp.]MCB2127065.1 hypothetical protein [Paracoccaceae bacterium]MCC0069106.1 hypothetical protein [Paracoccaceae bacterium]